MFRNFRMFLLVATAFVLGLGSRPHWDSLTRGLSVRVLHAADDVPAKPLAAAVPGIAPGTQVFVAEHRTEKSRTLENAMRQQVSYKFVEMPLKDALGVLQKTIGIEITVDEAKISDEGVSLDQPISDTGTGVPFADALERNLEPLQLTWVIYRERVLITTTVAAAERLETLVYGVAEFFEWDYQCDDLANLLVDTIQPETWDEVGGPGTVRATSDALVIRQTQHVHREIAVLLADLKRVAQRGDIPRGGANGGQMSWKVYRTGRFSATEVAKAIQEIVDPETWQQNGGKGQIRPLEEAGAAAENPAVPGTVVDPHRWDGWGARHAPTEGGAVVIRNLQRVHNRTQKFMTALGERKYVGGGGAGGQPSPAIPQHGEQTPGKYKVRPPE